MNDPRRALLALLTDLQQAGVEALPLAGRPSATSVVSPAPSHPSHDHTERKVDPVARPPSPDESGAAHLSSPPGALLNMADPQPRTAAPQGLAEEKSAAPSLEVLAEEVAACTRCGELASSRTQTVFADGNPAARLVFLGEAPGADEDRQGKPFVGRAGKLLTDIIEKGMKLRRSDVYIMNVLKCRPPGNRTPLPHEAHNCRPFLLRQLELVGPEFVCCLGAVAAQNLLQTTQSIGKMRGRFFDLGGIRVMCTYHPAYLLRNPSAKKQTWEDIQMLMQALGLP